MHTQVKTKSADFSVDFGISALVAKVWFIYFLMSIVAVGGVIAFGLAVPLYILGFILPASGRAADRVMNTGIRFLMKIQPWLDAKIELDLPQDGKGHLLVSNHRSHLDAFILLSEVRGIRILAKKSLFYVPFLGVMMNLMRQIPVRRGDLRSFILALEKVGELLARGETIHVFPELTRCPPGFKGTRDFSVAPFRTAKQGEFPVIPIVFEGTDAVWPRSTLSLHFRKKIRVRSLGVLHPKDFQSSDELMREAKRRIDEALEK